MSSATVARLLAEHCSTLLRAAYAALLQKPAIDDDKWAHATMTRRMGGFGLRDPRAILQSARLASLVNTKERALELGASQRFMTVKTEKADAAYMGVIHTDIHPQLLPLKDLQRLLTQPIHQMVLDRLAQAADEPTKQRLNSLTTPHAIAWLDATFYTTPMTPTEYRCAHLWAGGHPFRDAPYTCPDCGVTADPYGVHAVGCLRSGYITRGHNALRDAVAELFQQAGIPT